MANSRFERPVFFMLAGGLGCFLLSFFVMGLAPWTSLKHVTDAAHTDGNPYYTESGELTAVGRGRNIYIREACWHCHSQFVRPVAGEPYRYGPASKAWESMYDIPQTFGTRRIGPDLSREAGRHPDDWHLAHLYNPRITTPLSVMPSYSWFFEKSEEGRIVPKQEAKDLVAYLQYLGGSYKDMIQAIVFPKLFKVTGSPFNDEVTRERGQVLFQENCLGCHGPKGDGQGRAVSILKPAAANLVDRYVSASEIYSILARGVLGSAMPSFREMPERDLWAIALYVSELGDQTKEKMLAQRASADMKLVSQGKALFESRCVACHGSSASGDGPAAVALNPRPKDFTRRLFREEYLKEILAKGIEGSAMPAFSNLSEVEVKALSAYLTQAFNKEL